MSDSDDLKKILKDLGALLKKLFLSLYKVVDGFVAKIVPNEKIRLIILIAGLSFLGGVFVTSLSSGKKLSLPGGDVSLLRYLFAPKYEIAGEQENGSFALSNFESIEDLKLWNVRGAKIDIVKNHETEGAQAARITIFGDIESAALNISDYFFSRGAKSNWSQYQYLAFDLHNPHSTKQRLILQIKDKNGARFKKNLRIPAKSTHEFRIPLIKVDSMIDIKNIVQFSIFVWKPKIARDYYLDNLRLIPPGDMADHRDIYERNFPKAPDIKSRPVNPVDYGFAAVKKGWMTGGGQGMKPVVQIPFVVKDDSGAVRDSWPAQGGVPFPQGELMSEKNIRVVIGTGQEIPFQTRVLGKWPDGSIKWLQVDIQSKLNAHAGAGYFIQYGPEVRRKIFESPLVVQETDEAIDVTTGPLQFTVNKGSFYLFKSAYVDLNGDRRFDDSELIAEKVPLKLMFQDKTFSSHLDKAPKVEIEEKGTEKVAIKASGWFYNEDGKRFCQWIVRIHAFRGKSYVRVYHTFVYTGYPANRYYDRYKGIDLPENETIDEISIELPFNLRNGKETVSTGIHNSQITPFTETTRLSLFQQDFDNGTLEKDGAVIGDSLQGLGWINVSDGNKGITVATRDFRENFPKEYVFDGEKDKLIINLWPKRFGELDLQTTADAVGPGARGRGSAFGLAKTHELFFNFYAGDLHNSGAVNSAHAFQQPLLIRVNPYWLRTTGAFGFLRPADQKYAQYEEMLERLFDWADSQPRYFKWYGMIDYGDTLSWYRNEDDEKWYGNYDWHPVGRWGWYNAESAGTHTGALLQFARSGKYKYFRFGENLARHIMDVDTVHYNTIKHDPRLKKLDDEVSKVGSMHRHNGNHWGGRNEEMTHTNIDGIILYYYLTGYERAADVAKEVGNFVKLLPVTYTQHEDHAAHRALANLMWNAIHLYELTGDEEYKKIADVVVEIYLDGQNEDGSYNETYDPTSGNWTGKKHLIYMSYYTVRAFVRYHQLTQDKEILTALEKMVQYIQRADKYSRTSIMDGAGYAYLMTKNPHYIKAIENDLNFLRNNQLKTQEVTTNGLVFNKMIYHRANVLLHSVPFAFAALEDSFLSQRRKSS